MYKVMIVEDESKIRQGLRVLLEEVIQGYKVCWEANNGQRAIDILQIDIPELIITDIRMPKMSGIEFIKLVRSKLPHIPIIVLSGYDDFDYVREALRYSVKDYLLKPINRKELAIVLGNIFYKKIDSQKNDEPYLIAKIKMQINDHLSSELSLDSLAKIMNLHPNYISTLFKKHSGIRISEYITQQRMKKAKELLSHSQLKISDIAVLTGFSNPKYFSSVFKKHMIKTPQQYRNENKS